MRDGGELVVRSKTRRRAKIDPVVQSEPGAREFAGGPPYRLRATKQLILPLDAAKFFKGFRDSLI